MSDFAREKMSRHNGRGQNLDLELRTADQLLGNVQSWGFSKTGCQEKLPPKIALSILVWFGYCKTAI